MSKAKSSLQNAIDYGQINSMRELLDWVARAKFEVTRNGANYLGLRGSDGRRFRVRFDFVNETRKPKLRWKPLPENEASSDEPGSIKKTRCYWIYALTAHSIDGERKACYIGQTVNLKRRFRDHLNRHRPGRSSYALFEWAAHEQVTVHAVVLSRGYCDQSYSCKLEGYWLKLAVEAGFMTPDAHKWGRLPVLEYALGQPNQWPVAAVSTASIPLLEVVERGIWPIELYTLGSQRRVAAQASCSGEGSINPSLVGLL